VALETLKDVKVLGKFNVIVMDELREKHPEKFNESGAMDWQWFEKDVRPNNFVFVRHDKNSLSFTLQNGPVKEHGVNGCQVDTVILAALEILKGLDSKFPCIENKEAIHHLREAVLSLNDRTLDRENRGVEGVNVP